MLVATCDGSFAQRNNGNIYCDGNLVVSNIEPLFSAPITVTQAHELGLAIALMCVTAWGFSVLFKFIVPR